LSEVSVVIFLSFGPINLPVTFSSKK